MSPGAAPWPWPPWPSCSLQNPGRPPCHRGRCCTCHARRRQSVRGESVRERASARVRERARERARGIGAQDVARRQPALSGAEGELHVLDALHCPQVLKANAFRPLADLGHLRFVERILDEASHRCSRHGHRRMRTGRGPVYSLHSRVRVARQGWVQASLHTTRGARHEPRAGRRAHCGREAREHGGR